MGNSVLSAHVGEKICVYILTYNHVNVIQSTLESILDQTITGYEVIVSDDCSTDGTWESIIELAARDKRIRPLRTPQNLGMPGNANFAVSHSDRPYIALLHHDDLYRRDLLERWSDVVDRYPSVGFVFNPYDDRDAEYNYGPRLEKECVDGRWFLEKRLFAHWGCAVRGTAMIRRSLWNRVGGMREQFRLLADVDLWMRLSAIADVGYVPEPLIGVRALRPDYYPEIYNATRFNWPRWTLLYHIHASNRLAYLRLNTLQGSVKWLGFRLKLSCETAKWLVYGIVRANKRTEVLRYGSESKTPYDLWPLRVFRGIILMFARPIVH